jgi:hypothetical protein
VRAERRDALKADLLAALPPWIVARVLVGVAYVVVAAAADEMTRSGSTPKLDQHLLAWDGDWYDAIADRGYGPLPAEAVRFFPLFPLLGRGVGFLLLGNQGLGLVVVANLAALVAGMLIHRLALEETGEADLARRAAWFLALFPGAFVLVWGYAEGLLLVALIGAFLALRRQSWWWVAGLGLLAGLARPLGVVLVIPVLWEVVRSREGIVRGAWVPRVAAVVGAPLGIAAYLSSTWAGGDGFFSPFTEQSPYRGAVTEPVSRLVDAVGDLVGASRVGDAVHPAVADALRPLHGPGGADLAQRRELQLPRALRTQRLPAGLGAGHGDPPPRPRTGRPGPRRRRRRRPQRSRLDRQLRPVARERTEASVRGEPPRCCPRATAGPVGGTGEEELGPGPLAGVGGEELEHLGVAAVAPSGEGVDHEVGEVEVADHDGVRITEGQERGRCRRPGADPGELLEDAASAGGIPGDEPLDALGPAADPQDHLRPPALDTEGVKVRIAQLGDPRGRGREPQPGGARRRAPVAPAEGPERLPGLETGHLLLEDRGDEDLDERAGGRHPAAGRAPDDLGRERVVRDEVLGTVVGADQRRDRVEDRLGPGAPGLGSDLGDLADRRDEDVERGRSGRGVRRSPEAVVTEPRRRVLSAATHGPQRAPQVDQRDAEGPPPGRRLSRQP